MKRFQVLCVVLAAASLWLLPAHVMAAGKYDGSVPLVCVPLAVTECGAEGECQKGTPRSVNLPQFFNVDLKAMTVRAVEENRASTIRTADRVDGKTILQGVEG